MRRLARDIHAVLLSACMLVLASCFLVPTAVAGTGKRVALVIGNADYKVAPRLDNPVYDAKAVAETLKRLGFQVTEGYDQSVAQMRDTMAEFAASLLGSEAALVYYAGHAVSVEGMNYLLPVDTALKTEADLDFSAFSLSLVLRQLRREERVNVVILDACRDNPFAADLLRAGTRLLGGERGLSRVEGELARGVLIAFASDPKSAALDGRPGEHSAFTKALLDHLEDPNVSIETTMSRVRTEVWESTKNRQSPWVNSSIVGEFDLNPGHEAPIAPTTPAAPPPTAPAPPPVAAAPPPASEPVVAAADRQAVENLLWETAQRSNLAADYRDYLNAFPNGAFAAMARDRIAALTLPATSATTRAPDVAAHEIAPAAKYEIGTEGTERALNLGPADRTELLLRLAALKLDPGPAAGEIGLKARAAIRTWQEQRGFTPSGWLTPTQYSVLKSESEADYAAMIRRQPTIQPVAPVVRQAPQIPPRHAARATDAGGPPKPVPHPVAPPPAIDQASGRCGPGLHEVGATNGNGFRCAQNGF